MLASSTSALSLLIMPPRPPAQNTRRKELALALPNERRFALLERINSLGGGPADSLTPPTESGFLCLDRTNAPQGSPDVEAAIENVTGNPLLDAEALPMLHGGQYERSNDVRALPTQPGNFNRLLETRTLKEEFVTCVVELLHAKHACASEHTFSRILQWASRLDQLIIDAPRSGDGKQNVQDNLQTKYCQCCHRCFFDIVANALDPPKKRRGGPSYS